MAKLASIFFSMMLVNNYVLVKFMGICPFLGVSKKLDSSVGMSAAVTFVMLWLQLQHGQSTIICWFHSVWNT